MIIYPMVINYLTIFCLSFIETIVRDDCSVSRFNIGHNTMNSLYYDA